MKEHQIAAFIGVTLIKDGRMVAAFGANDSRRPGLDADRDRTGSWRRGTDLGSG